MHPLLLLLLYLQVQMQEAMQGQVEMVRVNHLQTRIQLGQAQTTGHQDVVDAQWQWEDWYCYFLMPLLRGSLLKLQTRLVVTVGEGWARVVPRYLQVALQMPSW